MTARRFLCFLAGTTVLAACGSPSLTGPSGATPSFSAVRPEAVQIARWQSSVTQTSFPSDGCFKASYPAMRWSRVACAAVSQLPLELSTSARFRANTAGGGHDMVAVVNSGRTISRAIGSFPSVIGVTGENTVGGGSNAIAGLNSYTLQINPQFFNSASCPAPASNCQAWEQFVLSNPARQGAQHADIYMQYWFVHKTTSFTSCPSGMTLSVGDCFANSKQSPIVPLQSIVHLANLSLVAVAAAGGDKIFFSTGTDVYGTQVRGAPITDLYKHWTKAEFNIFGNCCGSMAQFNGGSTIAVRLQVNDGHVGAPSCSTGGYTKEVNNLSFVQAPDYAPETTYPSILFIESNALKGTATCDTFSGDGK